VFVEMAGCICAHREAIDAALDHTTAYQGLIEFTTPRSDC
jgi:hypothetical protein